MLKLIIGPQTNALKVMLGDEDVTQQLRIAGLTIGPLGPNEMTQATLTVYAEAEVELLPEGVTVNVLDPESPAADEPQEEDPRDKLYSGPVRKP